MSATSTTGIAAIVSLMQTHDVPGVQEHGCALLGVLANDNKDNKYAIARVGGIDAIIHAMKTHPKEGGTQAYGIEALARLAFRHKDNQTAIVKADGVAAILTAMETHYGNAQVQTNGCGALLNLAAMLDDCQKALGVSAIDNAMQRHPAADQMREFGHAARVSLTT